MQPFVLYHRKTAREEGWSMLRAVRFAVLAAIAMDVVAYFLFFEFAWERDRLFVYIWAGFPVAVVGLMCYMAYLQISNDGVFECYLDPTVLWQTVPSYDGTSFVLPLDQLAKIEWENDDGARRFYLCSRSGRRYEICRNYDNPWEDFLDAIRKLRPDIVEGDKEYEIPSFFWPWKPPKE